MGEQKGEVGFQMVEERETEKEIRRGEIYYISSNFQSFGSEQTGCRPGIIVSNDTGNKYSSLVEVVYLTTKPKADLPTHVMINSAKRPSTALCEQVTTVSKDRITEYLSQCTDAELKRIDEALMISLNLDSSLKTSKIYNQTIESQREKISELTSELEKLKLLNSGTPADSESEEDKDCDISNKEATPSMFSRTQKQKPENKECLQNQDGNNKIIRLETERDTYKNLYESLIAKLIAS